MCLLPGFASVICHVITLPCVRVPGGGAAPEPAGGGVGGAARAGPRALGPWRSLRRRLPTSGSRKARSRTRLPRPQLPPQQGVHSSVASRGAVKRVHPVNLKTIQFIQSSFILRSRHVKHKKIVSLICPAQFGLFGLPASALQHISLQNMQWFREG